MQFRVSMVPPLLEMMMVRVASRSSRRAWKTLSIPAGSVLSRKERSILSSGESRASATNMGPRLDPPIPPTMTWRKASPFSVLISPLWTLAVKAFTAATQSSMAALSSAVGASSGARSQ